jgi:hypothetical protein
MTLAISDRVTLKAHLDRKCTVVEIKPEGLTVYDPQESQGHPYTLGVDPSDVVVVDSELRLRREAMERVFKVKTSEILTLDLEEGADYYTLNGETDSIIGCQVTKSEADKIHIFVFGECYSLQLIGYKDVSIHRAKTFKALPKPYTLHNFYVVDTLPTKPGIYSCGMFGAGTVYNSADQYSMWLNGQNICRFEIV